MTLNSDISLGTSITDIPSPWCCCAYPAAKSSGATTVSARSRPSQNYYGTEISALVSGFDLKWVLDGRRRPEMTRIGERWFNVSAGIVHPQGGPCFAVCHALLAGVHHRSRACAAADDARHVIAEIMCDNYDDIMKSASETEKAALVAALNNVVLEWTSGIEGLLRRTDRDKYLFLFNEKGYKSWPPKGSASWK